MDPAINIGYPGHPPVGFDEVCEEGTVFRTCCSFVRVHVGVPGHRLTRPEIFPGRENVYTCAATVTTDR
jgi:hypothetical protein